MTMPLIYDECTDDKHDACRLRAEALHSTMQRHWNNAVVMFRDAHAVWSITELLDNLNHLNKMTDQLEYLRASTNDGDAIRVAYTTSGEPTAAIIESTSAVVESTSYQSICQSKNEVYYLVAIINSNELAKQVKPLCPTNWAKEYGTSTSTAGSSPSRARCQRLALRSPPRVGRDRRARMRCHDC